MRRLEERQLVVVGEPADLPLGERLAVDPMDAERGELAARARRARG